MKYYLFASSILLAGALAVFLSSSKSTDRKMADHFATKRQLVEVETKVRPAHFEDMKWKSGAAIEMRAPASSEGIKN
jgi:hypothetical protein